MLTECNERTFEFQGLGRRAVTGRFDGGAITSDAGGLLLREVETKTGILRRFAACFSDYRDPELVEHTVYELLAQRVFALALGYEDLNDHDTLRYDPLLAVLVGKLDPTGQDRRRERDRGKALAGKSTLNRLELTPVGADAASRYKKIVACHRDIEPFFVETFLDLHPQPPEEIVLDLDATDDPLHGHQLGRFFHGYYDNYCYLPLYIFCGEHLLCAKLRPSDIDGAASSVKHLARIVAQVRERWPRVRIVGQELHEAKVLFGETRQATRVFKDFVYQTKKSWSRQRRVVGKAEHLSQGSNPRFVVTSLSAERWDARALYEDLYCARGEMENRIKEQPLCLFADRTSCATMRANQR